MHLLGLEHLVVQEPLYYLQVRLHLLGLEHPVHLVNLLGQLVLYYLLGLGHLVGQAVQLDLEDQ